jgi:hypothetical protein
MNIIIFWNAKTMDFMSFLEKANIIKIENLVSKKLMNFNLMKMIKLFLLNGIP